MALAALIAIKPGQHPRLIYRVHKSRRRGKEQSARIPATSSTTTGSTEAATSRPGNSRNSSQKRSARASGHCVIVRAEARVRYVPGLRPGPRPPLQLPPARAG